MALGFFGRVGLLSRAEPRGAADGRTDEGPPRARREERRCGAAARDASGAGREAIIRSCGSNEGEGRPEIGAKTRAEYGEKCGERLSERLARRVLGRHRSTQRRARKGRTDDAALTADIVALATQYGRYGDRRITAMLRETGWAVNVTPPEPASADNALDLPRAT